MWKILCKNILALYRYRDFRVGIFYFASPCIPRHFRHSIDFQTYRLHNFAGFLCQTDLATVNQCHYVFVPPCTKKQYITQKLSKGPFIATQLNSTELNSTQLTQLNSVQPISTKQVSRVFVYDLINGPLSSVELCHYKHPLTCTQWTAILHNVTATQKHK